MILSLNLGGDTFGNRTVGGACCGLWETVSTALLVNYHDPDTSLTPLGGIFFMVGVVRRPKTIIMQQACISAS